jgi:hypothetical protein
MKTVLALLCILAVATADLYMHNPRGNNDRLNEASANRDNANRLFDSQNNAKGGYCYGPAMSFYEGSQLSLEWTSQHGCGNPKLYCNLVVQYMCGNKDDPMNLRIRDGTTTSTIPDDATGPVATDANGELTFGMNEPYQYYQDCKTRQRNLGLYISDREEEGGLTVNGRPSAIFTRQNNNGNRHGYECTEERDYYPYWHPSPWKDIAIITSDKNYCPYYQVESQNVKAKGYCKSKDSDAQVQYNNPVDCGSKGGVWTETAAWGIAPPECVLAQWSRDNHLGNGQNGFQNSYNWTLPTSTQEPCIEKDNCNCILRLRYNISTGELSNSPGNEPFTDWTYNGDKSGVKQDDIVKYAGNDYLLATDTTQYGRTFQDRSYVFHIKPRPDGVAGRIFNLNVRGKRGNIVQAYPATEYDFVPEILYARVGDYIHFQWTGCDTNPAGNAGEGTDGTDRHNIVQNEAADKNYPASDEWLENNTPLFEDPKLRARFAFLDQSNCLSYEDLLAKNNGNNGDAEDDVQNCMLLNAASPYFDGGLVHMNLTGDFYYMSTRNNNFTNRGQKAAIHITNLLPTWAIVVVVLGCVIFLGSGGVAGAMLYAKSHPHSGVANLFSKI